MGGNEDSYCPESPVSAVTEPSPPRPPRKDKGKERETIFVEDIPPPNLQTPGAPEAAMQATITTTTSTAGGGKAQRRTPDFMWSGQSPHRGWETSNIAMAKCDFCSRASRGVIQKCEECKLIICKECYDLGKLDVDDVHHIEPGSVSWEVPKKAIAGKGRGSTSKAPKQRKPRDNKRVGKPEAKRKGLSSTAQLALNRMVVGEEARPHIQRTPVQAPLPTLEPPVERPRHRLPVQPGQYDNTHESTQGYHLPPLRGIMSGNEMGPAGNTTSRPYTHREMTTPYYGQTPMERPQPHHLPCNRPEKGNVAGYREPPNRDPSLDRQVPISNPPNNNNNNNNNHSNPSDSHYRHQHASHWPSSHETQQWGAYFATVAQTAFDRNRGRYLDVCLCEAAAHTWQQQLLQARTGDVGRAYELLAAATRYAGWKLGLDMERSGVVKAMLENERWNLGRGSFIS